MRRALAGISAGLALFLAAPALAQPETKLADKVDAKARYVMWCSAVFYEESLWYDDDNAWSEYYAVLGDELGWQSGDMLDNAGLSDAEQDELWLIYDDGAAELAGDDEDAFFDILDACEADFGSLAERPQE